MHPVLEGEDFLACLRIPNLAAANKAFAVWPQVEPALRVPHNDREYRQLVKQLDRLVDEVGEDENHPLASMMEVIGVLIVPPADPMLSPPQALGNTYASLTELNHYSRPGSTFTAHYDERNGQTREKDAPFSRCYLLPGSAAGRTP